MTLEKMPVSCRSWSSADGGHPYVSALIPMRRAWPLPDGGRPYVSALILMRRAWSSPDGGIPMPQR